MKTEIVNFEVHDQIGILTLGNGSSNKISKADFLDLNELKQLIAGSDLKALIIAGRGRHFSSGADIDKIRKNCNRSETFLASLKEGKAILNYIESLPIITVAAISGICFGAGFEIALSCQFRVITKNGILAFPESGIGIMPGLAGTFRLPKKVGKAKALEIIISGRSILAEEAYELGLADRITENKQHLTAAIKFIQDISFNKSKEQIECIIKSVNNSFSVPAAQAMDEEGKMFLQLSKKI